MNRFSKGLSFSLALADVLLNLSRQILILSTIFSEVSHSLPKAPGLTLILTSQMLCECSQARSLQYLGLSF